MQGWGGVRCDSRCVGRCVGRRPIQAGQHVEQPARQRGRGRGDQQVGRVGVGVGQQQAAQFHHQGQQRGQQRREPRRPAPGPAQHAQRGIAQQRHQQAEQGMRLGAVVVVVQRQQAQRLPACTGAIPVGLGQAGPAVGQGQQRQMGQQQQRCAAPQQRAALRHRQPAQPRQQCRAQCHADGPGEHRGALAHARGHGQLAQLDGQAQHGAGQQHRQRAWRAGCTAAPCGQPQAHRQHRQGLHQQLAQPQRPGARGPTRREPGANQLTLPTRLPLGRAQQQIERKQRQQPQHSEVDRAQPAPVHGRGAALQRLPRGLQPARNGKGQQRAQRGADGFGQQVVARHGAWRKEQLRELHQHGQRQRQQPGQHGRPQGRAASASQRQRAQQAQRQVEHAVGDPVGALLHAQLQQRDLAEAQPGLVERQRAPLPGHQAAVDHEGHPQGPRQPGRRRCHRRGIREGPLAGYFKPGHGRWVCSDG